MKVLGPIKERLDKAELKKILQLLNSNTIRKYNSSIFCSMSVCKRGKHLFLFNLSG